eukprot:TRINITY_DN14093_c0_g1_i2.p1 TRINITY_DN14093_c0_g1~~TRINITY_DN14093_c0_g1_i2.p1  ORF type:complete len:1167 (-),score=203.12 TRINITY_DN14093_c0_g1_i2:577-4077(-)
MTVSVVSFLSLAVVAAALLMPAWGSSMCRKPWKTIFSGVQGHMIITESFRCQDFGNYEDLTQAECFGLAGSPGVGYANLCCQAEQTSGILENGGSTPPGCRYEGGTIIYNQWMTSPVGIHEGYGYASGNFLLCKVMTDAYNPSDQHTCNTGSTGWTCDFLPGDGAGGAEEYIGTSPSEAECADLVRSTRPSANGVTYGPDDTDCYAEWGMNSRSDSPTWRSCIFATVAPTAAPTPVPTPAPTAAPTLPTTTTTTTTATTTTTTITTTTATTTTTVTTTTASTTTTTMTTTTMTSTTTATTTTTTMTTTTATTTTTTMTTATSTTTSTTTTATTTTTTTSMTTAAPTPTPTPLPTVAAEVEASMSEEDLEAMKMIQETKQMETQAAIDALATLTHVAANDTRPIVIADEQSPVVVVAQRLVFDAGGGSAGDEQAVEVSTPGSPVKVAVPMDAVADLLAATLGSDASLSDVALVIAAPKDSTTSNATETEEKSIPLNMGSEGNGVKSLGPVSVSMYLGAGKLGINGLSAPIKVTMSPPNHTRRGNGPQVCAYYNESTSSWSTEGVNLTVGEDGAVACLTTHLTIFAVVDLLKEIAELLLSCVRAELFTAESVKNIVNLHWVLKPPAALVWFAGLLHLVLLAQAVRKDRQHASAPLPRDADLLTRDDRHAPHNKPSFRQSVSAKLAAIGGLSAQFRADGFASILKLAVCSFASNVILLSAAARARLCEKSVQLMSEHCDSFRDNEPFRLEGGADADEGHVISGIRNKIDDTLQYIDSFSTEMKTIIKPVGAARFPANIAVDVKDLGKMPQRIKQSAPSGIFMALFMAAEPACRATRYSWTSTSWTRMMGRTVYFTGALAFQALTFQFDGSAQQEDSDPRCSQKTLMDKVKIGAMYSTVSFLLSALPAKVFEAAWERKFVHFPSDRPEEEFVRARASLARKWACKDRVLSTVSFVYLSLCWFVIVSFAANVDAKGGMEDLLFSLTWSLAMAFIVSPLGMAAAQLMILVLLRCWKGGELLEQAVAQAREKLIRRTEADTHHKDDEPSSGGTCKCGATLVRVAAPNDGWGCDGRFERDGCESGITDYYQTEGLDRWECRRCDYDLCTKCHDRQLRCNRQRSGSNEDLPTLMGGSRSLSNKEFKRPEESKRGSDDVPHLYLTAAAASLMSLDM